MISILLSVYNSENTVLDTLQSIKNQTYDKFEVIIIDDNSNDKSWQVIQNFCITDQRFHPYRNEENKGLPYNLNKALSLSKYNYIARIDADDICVENRLEIQYGFMRNNSMVDILGSNAFLIDANKKIIGKTNVPNTHKEIITELRYKNPILHPSVMIKRKVLEDLKGFNEKLLKAQDYDLWRRANKKKYIFNNLDNYLIMYRVETNKPISTIYKGFKVSLSNAIKYRSIIGILYSFALVLRLLLIKFKLYTPYKKHKIKE